MHEERETEQPKILKCSGCGVEIEHPFLEEDGYLLCAQCADWEEGRRDVIDRDLDVAQ